ncbi:hypothetical protein KQX54_018635 [Cotesia glomerata]|uniref:Uncharacterized protein n=1 Tax=Cotesia glomerata TaxID=32391 RepID=A0AAV7I4D9_COTGL|nr:hypothetical protein KQX54_018635 [Cotesia glomerata]
MDASRNRKIVNVKESGKSLGTLIRMTENFSYRKVFRELGRLYASDYYPVKLENNRCSRKRRKGNLLKNHRRILSSKVGLRSDRVYRSH